MNKTIRNILIWTFIAGYFVAALSFTASKRKQQLCSGVELIIKDTTRNIFIDRGDAIALIENRIGKFLGYPADSINIADVEEAINMHPAVKNAEVYLNSEGTVNIELIQRNPILRVYSEEGDDFYIDEEGAIMPLSDRYVSRLLVFSGNIPLVEVPASSKMHVSDLAANDSILKDIYEFGKFIYRNKFWKAQIEQVYIDERNEFELTTKVGMQQVMMGTLDNFEKKLSKLKTLYTEGFNRSGWTKYDRINLKFDGQVVCTKQ